MFLTLLRLNTEVGQLSRFFEPLNFTREHSVLYTEYKLKFSYRHFLPILFPFVVMVWLYLSSVMYLKLMNKQVSIPAVVCLLPVRWTCWVCVTARLTHHTACTVAGSLFFLWLTHRSHRRLKVNCVNHLTTIRSNCSQCTRKVGGVENGGNSILIYMY